MTDVLIVAGGGLAREVLAADPVGLRFVGVLDDDVDRQGTVVDGIPVVGGLDQVVAHPHARLLLCAGVGATRRDLRRRLSDLGVDDDRFATALAPGVRVPVGCDVGPGCILLSSVVLTAHVRLGMHVVAMPNVTVTHDVDVGDYATLCAGVSLGGGVQVGEAAYLGMNASVRQGARVGRDATLGMGAALLRDLPDRETWVGVPARALASARAGGA